MNPFVIALYDELPFCKSGCGHCIHALRMRMQEYNSDHLEEWEIIASVSPSILVLAPHWEQRLRHLLGVRELRQGRGFLDPYLSRIIVQWLATSQSAAVDYKHLLFIDFLLWDICHKLHAVCQVDHDLYSRVVHQATDIAVQASDHHFGAGEFDSLVESLYIIRQTDGISYHGLDNLLEMPWSKNSRTARVLRASTSR